MKSKEEENVAQMPCELSMKNTEESLEMKVSGNPIALSFMLVRGMLKSEDIYHVFKAAIFAYEKDKELQSSN